MDYTKKILSKDKYISRKELTKLVNNLKLKGIILDNEKLLTMVKYHNDKFIIKKQKEYKNYFEHIFDEVDPNIKLDEEQIKTILTDQDYCLVVAGAGSGKTTTMSAKVKYLIEKQNVNPNNIIIMSFTKKATEELEDRINKQFKLGAKVTTFHKLGMEIIKKSYKKYIKVITEEQKQQILKNFIVENLFYDKKLLKKINDAFCNYLLFDRKVKKYKTFDDYYIYYIKKIYKQNKTNINEYNERIIKEKMLNHTTINNQEYNERTKILISNFLFKLNIPYYDKKSFPHKNKFMTIENKNNTSFFILNDELYYEEIKKIKFSSNVKVVPYIENMTRIMKNTDIIISRAGASTLSEIIALKIPSILIPSPYVPDNHQYKNALDLSSNNAAILIEEKDLNGNILVKTIDEILNDEEKIKDMKKNLEKLYVPKSATKIYETIRNIIDGK